MECERLQANLDYCKCTYEPCSRKGRCCECIRYHLESGQLPACAFTAEAERTYDRTFRKFIETNS